MRYLSSLLLCVVSLACVADEDWLNHSLEILHNAIEQSPDAFLATPSAQQKSIARSIAEASQQEMLAQLQQQDRSSHAPANGVILFATFSMPDADLRHLYQLASRDPSIHIVFRGLEQGKNLSATFATIKQMIKGIEPAPNVIIDPTLFTEFNVTVAPAMYAFVDGVLQAHARGIVSTDWIFKRIDQGANGDLGKHGTTYVIAERDLIEEMQARLAEQDFASKKQAAIHSYWDKYTFISLTPAEKDAIFELDPTIHVKQAIVTPDGKVIARAGQRVNPLETLPFTKKIVVFNPARKNEVQYVTELQAVASDQGYGLILVATEIDRIKGWDSLNQTQANFDSTVYLLNAQLQQRFNFRHTPTTVHAENNRFIITETYLGSL